MHAAKVWVVALSANGAFVAAGDYANVVRVYEKASGAPLWEKRTWLGEGAPFTWGLAWASDTHSHTLVIGHWDSYACVASTPPGTHHGLSRCVLCFVLFRFVWFCFVC